MRFKHIPREGFGEQSGYKFIWYGKDRVRFKRLPREGVGEQSGCKFTWDGKDRFKHLPREGSGSRVIVNLHGTVWFG